MWLTLLSAVAAAQSLDLPELEAARRAAEGEVFRGLAHQKRVESIARLEQLMTVDRSIQMLAEMRLRLADLEYLEGLAEAEPLRIRRAADLYRAIVAEVPDFARADQAIFSLGCAERELGRPERAAELWAQVVRDYPGSAYIPDAYTGIGDQRSSAGDWAGARVAYVKAAASVDRQLYPYTMYRLGWAEHHTGDADAGNEALRVAATSADTIVAAAAARDLSDLTGEVVVAAAPAPVRAPSTPPPGCDEVERGLRRQIEADPAPRRDTSSASCSAGSGRTAPAPKPSSRTCERPGGRGPRGPRTARGTRSGRPGSRSPTRAGRCVGESTRLGHGSAIPAALDLPHAAA